MKKIQIKRKWIYLGMVATMFLVLAVVFPITLTPDAGTYLDMHYMREPIYPLFLKLLKLIFRDHFYFAVKLTQNMICAFITWYAAEIFIERFHISACFVPIVYCCLLIPPMISTFFSVSHILVTNSVLSEGLSVSVYLLWFVYTWLAVVDVDYHAFHKALACSALLMLIRGHMKYTLIIMICVSIYLGLKQEQKKIKEVGVLFFKIGIMLLFVSIFTRGYMYFVHGSFVSTLAGPETVVTNVLLVSDEEDVQLFEDDLTKKIYSDICQKMREEELGKKYITGGLLKQALELEQEHDKVKFHALHPALNDRLKEVQEMEEIELAQKKDKICRDLFVVLLPKHIGEFLYHYIGLVILGITRSVAFYHPILLIYTILIIVIAICLAAIRSKDNHFEDAVCMWLALLCIMVNAGSVSAVIYCLSRYMIYNMPFFYLAGFLMLYRIGENYIRQRKGLHE